MVNAKTMFNFRNDILNKASEKLVYHKLISTLGQYNLLNKNIKLEITISKNKPKILLTKVFNAIVFIIWLSKLRNHSQKFG